MKKFKFIALAAAALLMAGNLTACSDDEPKKDTDKPVTPVDPTPDTPDTPDVPTPEPQDYHFDLWVAVDQHGGMARDVQTLVRSVESLDADQPEISFVGEGAEVNKTMTLESIVKGEFYYQVPVSADRFSKYVIKDNQITVIAERQFKDNTYAARKYTHAWTDDNTLVIMAANADADKILWTKLNTTDMSIVAEGSLGVEMPEGGKVFCTSGILNYRVSDNKLFYFYFAKDKSGRKGVRITPMMTAVVNPETMAVESVTACHLDCEMVGTSYGELLQPTTFVADNNDIYVACVTDEADGEHSHLLKIPANSTKFDESYDGFTLGGKLISLMYLGGSEVMCYARNDALGTGIDDPSHYYTVLNVATKTAEPLKYNGEQLAYSGGRFSSRMAYVDGKAYVGVDPQAVPESKAGEPQPQIYIYDVASKTTALGAKLAPGFFFEQFRVVKNYNK